MNCDQVHPRLSPYLDGELDPETRSNIQDHLSTCPDCSLRLEEFRSIDKRVSKTINRNNKNHEDFTEQTLNRAEKKLEQCTPQSTTNSTGQLTSNEHHVALGVLTLVFGLLVGTYMGFSFLEVMPDQLPSAVQASSSQQATTRAAKLAKSTPTDDLAAVSLNDAYFEQGQADDSGR